MMTKSVLLTLNLEPLSRKKFAPREKYIFDEGANSLAGIFCPFCKITSSVAFSPSMRLPEGAKV